MTTPPDRLVAALADRYAIERELGSGGMATVYLAEDLKLRRKVAVKVLRPDLAAALGPERFLREIEVAAQLHHPHILPLHDSGEADGFLYYVMPYEEGQSLREKLAKEGELPIADAVRLLRDVVDGLAQAHKHGVVHRDIKPDNIMLSGRHALVTDFGVAKAVSEATGRQQLTTAGVALGTPAYMAPEQAAADPHIDHRADIYAVGALAYELLTRRPPFTGTTPQMVLSAHVTQAPELVTKHRETVPPALAQLVMRCLEKKPADRWQTAEELLQQLEALSTPSGGVTPTDTRPVAVVDTTRRATLVGAGALLGALVVAAVGWWLIAGRGEAVADRLGGRVPIAVLVFENRSAAEDDEFFSEGIADDINTQLSKIGGFAVKAHASARRLSREEMSYSEIADQLGAEYLVHGNWRRVGDSVRITARLIAPETEDQLWAENYDRELTASNMFGVRSDVAAQVAAALNVAVAPTEQTQLAAEPTASTEAYNAYQLGRFFWNQRTEEGLQRAVEYFSDAIGKDSNYALAYAGLSDSYCLLPWYGSVKSAEVYAQAKAAAQKAVDIDRESAEAHTSLAAFKWWYEWDWRGAEAEFERALALNPRYATLQQWYGTYLVVLGRIDEGIAHLEQALVLDPLSVVINREVANAYIVAGRYSAAVEQYQRTLEIDPNPDGTRWELALAYLFSNMLEESIAEFERVDDAASGLARVYAVQGDREKALRLLSDARTANTFTDWVFRAGTHLVLGNSDQAFALLDTAFAERSPELTYLLFQMPPWDSMRTDRRFVALMNRLGVNDAR